jgi:hypothetical protein
MKHVLLLLVLSFSYVSYGAIVVSADTKNKCTVYRVTSPEEAKAKLENVVEPRELYGLTIKNLKIDFETKSATVEITKRIVLAFDRPLLENRVVIKAENPNFDFLVNQLNRDLFTFDKVCIRNSNELVWATLTNPNKD